jgi:acetoin utilization deacetylase AcuC-like enzyme
VDLDGHYGNSIEDSRGDCPQLDTAIPVGCNINPRGVHQAYLTDLSAQLAHLEDLLLADRVQYVAVAHGADSHEDDPLGGQCTTREWLEAARIVHGMLNRVAARRGRPVSTVLALFGGYRQDFEFGLRLHAADLRIALGLADGWRD